MSLGRVAHPRLFMCSRLFILLFVTAFAHTGCSRATKILSNLTSSHEAASAQTDFDAPTMPLQFIGFPLSLTQIQLSWAASSDNNRVFGYKVYKNGIGIADTEGTTYTDKKGIVPGKIYLYSVSAYDFAGNESNFAPLIAVRIPGNGSGGAPPSTPENLVGTAFSVSQINLSWRPAIDDFEVAGYRIFRNGSEIGFSLGASFQDTGLSAATTYTYFVAALDGAGNASEPSSTIQVRTLSAPAISRSGWSIKYFDSQELFGENGAATNCIDGDPFTVWRTQWSGEFSPAPPHEVQIDMGQFYSVSGFQYVPKPDPAEQNGRISRYEFYLSSDGENWGTPVVSGMFTNDSGEKEVLFAARSARYLRLRALSEVNGMPVTMVAELNVFGAAGTDPGQGRVASLAFNTQPSQNGTVGVALDVQPVIGFRDAQGKPAQGNSWVTIGAYKDAACSVTASGILNVNSNPVAAVGGVATFAGIRYSLPETIYLGASTSGVPISCSTAIQIVPGKVVQLPTIPSPSPLPIGSAYYVAPNGSDSNDGSSGAPWASLSAACRKVQSAGTTIVVRAGAYTDYGQCILARGVAIGGEGKDQVRISVSASPYIIAENPLPVVEGNNDISGIGLLGSGGTGIYSVHRSYQRVHDCYFKDMTTSMWIAGKNPSGSGWCDSRPTETARYCENNWSLSREPGETDWAVGIEIYNNDMKNGRIFCNTIKNSTIHNNVVDNSEVMRSAVGNTSFWWNNVQFFENTLKMATISWSTIAVEIWMVQGDTKFNKNWTNGWFSILVNPNGPKTPYSWEITNNTFESDVPRGLGSMPVDVAIESSYETENVLIAGNYFANTGANQTYLSAVAIWGKGPAKNYLIRNNVTYNMASDVFRIQSSDQSGDRPFEGDNIQIYNNVIDGANFGKAAAVYIDDGAGTIRNVKIKNNVIMSARWGALISPAGHDVSGVEFTNNAMWGGGFAMDYGSGGFSSTANNFHFVPEFVQSGARPDPYYRPKPGSNLIDRGVNVGIPFQGAAPDLGAFEN